jgi:S1-C subfamily serine protease
MPADIPAGVAAEPGPAVAPNWGVRVNEARAGWPAAACGLRAGDVVVSVDGTPVASVEEIRATLAGKEVVEVTFRNCDTGQMEFTRVYPHNGLIGLNGQTVPLDD